MADIEAITREELLLNAIAGGEAVKFEPITRQEHYLSAIAGESDLPADMEPITREEIYYQKILDNGGAGGGGEATGTKTINITANGTTSHNVKAYATAQIITNVPNPSTGTKQINQNGTHDVTDFASASVNVPNSYSSSDEGKVVSNGALTAQTSRQVTANGTYDTTLNDEVTVNVPASGITPTGTKNITTNGDHDVTNFATAYVDVPTGITPSGSQTFTENGTYDVTSLAEAVVNVESGASLNDVITGNFPSGDIVISGSETIIQNALSYRSKIGKVTFTGNPALGANSFQNSSITELVGHNITRISGASAFLNCTSLKKVCIPKCEYLENQSFQGTSSLEIFECSATAINRGYVFRTSTLQTLILRSTSLCTLGNTNNLPTTLTKVYVPSSLVEDYKVASNWSTFVSNYGTEFLPIEGSIYETQYIDGTPIE